MPDIEENTRLEEVSRHDCQPEKVWRARRSSTETSRLSGFMRDTVKTQSERLLELTEN